ncbi:Asp23/Gls24 family envelope stress response protein [Cryobacterium sp. TMS1-20-1]|uniref:Asp23/Gls24 family envelope stress response protein n=1 Tax=Cryobacterium sp. TMS1-20-1 TaxID=1259223 RepID=UPI001069FD70|nr:Asp23/Gls24 family envelope stress response protein [Cryobacterium sp. TMS1-20-1]TFC77227.1 Asp23/Gls24 family envelope stress response protein [Cryobacterium sp. TMS1-20-1]
MDLIDTNGTGSATRSSGNRPPVGTTLAGEPLTGTGKTVINDGVVAKVAGIAVREVSGVHALGGGAARALGAIREAMNNTDVSQGISVEVGETQVAVDVTIVAEYPVQLQQVANDIRSSVIRAIEDLVGLEVTEVNVTIVDIHLPSDDAEAEPNKAALR